jgi:DnaJ-class molecular chaperone with C-terminal Zn finger domain
MQTSIKKKIFLLYSSSLFFLYTTRLESVVVASNNHSDSRNYSPRSGRSSSSWDYYHGASTIGNNNKGELDPYKILGVTRDVTQDDIKKVGG